MKREIPESVAKAINEIQSFCSGNTNCKGCPCWVPYEAKYNDGEFCVFKISSPEHWNVNEEKKYYIEYNGR